jgi:hypothetical protein
VLKLVAFNSDDDRHIKITSDLNDRGLNQFSVASLNGSIQLHGEIIGGEMINANCWSSQAPHSP